MKTAMKTAETTVRTRQKSAEPGLLLRTGLALLLASVAAGAGLALVAEPASPGLRSVVYAELAQSGAENPVTAVLLNFRGYDTLLEIAVLTAALVGVWALGHAPRIRETAPSPVLLGMTSVLLPLAAVICAYLLWVGKALPGGAFQAGSVLAAAGVLFILSGRRPRLPLPDLPMRWAAIVGLAVFLAVALGVMGSGRHFLEYPPGLAAALILLIETAATLSIAVILAGMFIGGRPPDEP
jgi:multisubunit Na+/H+ antiporter MnhB subunit